MAIADVNQDAGALRRLAVPAVLAAIFAVFFFAPLGFRWPCPLATLVHVPCPTCGMTRAARLAAHGDFAAATHTHPLWFLVLPFVATLAIVEIGHYVRAGSWGGAAKLPGARRAGYAILALLVGVWIARFFGAFGGPCPIG